MGQKTVTVLDIAIIRVRGDTPEVRYVKSNDMGVTVNAVCRAGCNNGWMRTLEDKLRPLPHHDPRRRLCDAFTRSATGLSDLGVHDCDGFRVHVPDSALFHV